MFRSEIRQEKCSKIFQKFFGPTGAPKKWASPKKIPKYIDRLQDAESLFEPENGLLW